MNGYEKPGDTPATASPARDARLPNLFVAGAPKCGTTSMHGYLGQHPDVFMCPSRSKEPQFYLYEDQRPEWHGPGDHFMNQALVVDRGDYLALFDGADGERFRGESSPYYLASAAALRKIVSETPDARFILMLRDPVDRAGSLWRHLWGQGRETERTVAAAIGRDQARREAGWEPFWQYREFGLYGRQVSDLLSLVPRSQVRVVYYDDFARDTQAVMAGVFGWLGLNGDVEVDTETKLMETPRIADTRRNRMLQSAVARKSGVKRLVPARMRRRVGAFLLHRLTARSEQAGAAEENARRAASERPELRGYFAEDLRVLQEVLGDVPPRWFE